MDNIETEIKQIEKQYQNMHSQLIEKEKEIGQLKEEMIRLQGVYGYLVKKRNMKKEGEVN